MKFRVTMKTPDAVEGAISDQLQSELGPDDDIDCYEFAQIVSEEGDKCDKWFRWGEIVTLEIDTDKGTATVVPV